MENARRAFLDSRFLAAEEAYQGYLQAYPRGGHRLEAWLRLADIAQDGRESPERAASLLEAALLEFGRDPAAAPDLLARSAELRLRRKDYARAAEHCNALLDLADVPAERRQEAWMRLARANLGAGRQDAALAAYASCAADRIPAPLAAGCILARAGLLGRMGQAGEAAGLLRGLYEDVSLPASLRGQAGFDWAMLLEAANDKAAAVPLLEAARKLHPNPAAVGRHLDALRQDAAASGR